jgi:hypothetical protein
MGEAEMSPEEAVKHLRVLTKDVSETDKEEVLRATLREVKNCLAKVQDTPTKTALGIPSSPRNPLRRGRP